MSSKNNKNIKKILRSLSDIEVPASLHKSILAKIFPKKNESAIEPQPLLLRIRRNISAAAAAVIIPVVLILILRLNFSFADTKSASLPFDNDLSNKSWQTQTLPVDNNFALIADINFINSR